MLFSSIRQKIILDRIISVVWLTNFLSEIWSLINPWWWGEHLLLSKKSCRVPALLRGACALMIACSLPYAGDRWRSCSLSGIRKFLIGMVYPFHQIFNTCLVWTHAKKSKIERVYLQHNYTNFKIIGGVEHKQKIPQTGDTNSLDRCG